MSHLREVDGWLTYEKGKDLDPDTSGILSVGDPRTFLFVDPKIIVSFSSIQLGSLLDISAAPIKINKRLYKSKLLFCGEVPQSLKAVFLADTPLQPHWPKSETMAGTQAITPVSQVQCACRLPDARYPSGLYRKKVTVPARTVDEDDLRLGALRAGINAVANMCNETETALLSQFLCEWTVPADIVDLAAALPGVSAMIDSESKKLTGLRNLSGPTRAQWTFLWLDFDSGCSRGREKTFLAVVVWLAALVDRVSTSATAKYKLPEEREKPKRDTSFKHTGISEGNNPSSFVEGQNVGAGAMSYSLLPPLGSMADAKVVIQAGENKQGDDLAIWCNKEYFCRNRQRAQECGLRILASHWKQSPPSVISKESFVKKVEDRGMKEDMEYDMEQGVLRTQPAPGGSVYDLIPTRHSPEVEMQSKEEP
ncbi:hypothetical protein M0657_001941 [Pyricularia oryzae]|nr:hypothetical protein M9X92_002789 [Pyricularia oryzae]KAI7929794.1 hypothetical protein M0657_001941 [Pyricularia oryzae]